MVLDSSADNELLIVVLWCLLERKGCESMNFSQYRSWAIVYLVLVDSAVQINRIIAVFVPQDRQYRLAGNHAAPNGVANTLASNRIY